MKNKMKRKTRERSAFFSEEIRKAAIIIIIKKKTSDNNIRLTVKRKRIFAAFLFFASSSFVRVLQVAIYARVYNAKPFSSPLTTALTTVRTLN